MIFDSLWESAQRKELLLIDGGMCHFHLRRDGQLTIREIISIKRGSGSLMLQMLKKVNGASSIFAKCPAELIANSWYVKQGFHLEDVSLSKKGRKINHWRLSL